MQSKNAEKNENVFTKDQTKASTHRMKRKKRIHKFLKKKKIVKTERE